MASKQLTATVRLNTTQAEKSIDRLVNKINRINNVLNKTSNGSSTKLPKNINKCTTATQQWATALNSVNSKLNGSKSLVKSIGSGLKTLADRYLGVMGMGVVVNTSDMITSAENKLNYVSAQNLGASGTNSDGSYSTATLNATQDAMDKMYTSAQKVRMSYTDMMANVSKSMALAGDSFKGNTDMAIRFQEIMAEAYAVGGASAKEMSSSMYQLIQALGAGTLAGDELRSVREGAPLAYKEIEKFAQDVYNTEESLKDLASQGKITSDMVVAAIMKAGNKMDSAFAQTEQTFAQTWEQIKNAATRAFTPVAKYLREALNKAIDNGLIEKFEKFFANVAKCVVIVFKVIENCINWIVDNWDWLRHVIVGILIGIIAFIITKTAISIACALLEAAVWIAANWEIALSMLVIGLTIAILVIAVLALLYVFLLWKQSAIDTVTAIALGIIIIGAACGGLVGFILVLIGTIILYFSEVCYWIGWLAAWIVNIVSGIFNFICAVMAVIVTFFYNSVANIVNGAMGMWNVIEAITENIGIAFQNAWTWAKNTFWEFIADVLDGVSKLEPVINGIAGLLGQSGVDFGGLISAAEGKKGEYKSFVSISDAWSSGQNTMERLNFGDAWNAGLSTFEYKDANAWGSTASNWAKGIEDKINKWGSKYQNWGSFDDLFNGEDSILDKIAKKLGIDPEKFKIDPEKFKLDFPEFDFNPSKALDNIDDNTSKMADSMDLTAEDVEYLRKIAAMEWKKEYTTANIKIDMTNNNNVNGESDLDGIVTKLSDKLREELSIVADGVYAY